MRIETASHGGASRLWEALPVEQDVDDLDLHLSQTRVADAAVPVDSSNIQVERHTIS